MRLMGKSYCHAQGLFFCWDDYEMDVIRHQAISKYGYRISHTVNSQLLDVIEVVVISKKRLLPPIATLSYVVGTVGNNDAR